MFSSITDPVKKAEAELDALLAEISPADQAPQSSEDTDISTAPVGNGTLDRQQSQPANTSAATDAELLAMSADAELKARYASLQGKYSAEVPRLASELAHVKRQLAELQSMPAATQMADGDTYRSPYVTDEMRSSRSYQKMAKEFGDDYAENNFEASALTAKQAARSEMQPFQDQVAQSATDRLHAEISRQAPDWMATNDDPKFIEWAKSTLEPYSGGAVIDLLNDAYSRGDVGRVATIFNDYNQMLTPTTNQTGTNRPSVDDLVSPARRGSAAQTAADTHQGRIWQEAEIDRFFDDHARGRYENRQKEAKEIEAEINRAYAEGRVR